MFNNASVISHEQHFKCLFDSYNKQVYAYVLGLTHSTYTAEEITQELFLKLWLCRDALSSITNLEAYIFTIAKNKTLNYFRQSANRQQLLQQLQSRMLPHREDAGEYTIVKENDQLLQEAITQLPAQRRIIYELSRDKGLNHAEIAIQLQLSKSTVKNQLVHALRFIRSYLTRSGALPIYLIHFLLF